MNIQRLTMIVLGVLALAMAGCGAPSVTESPELAGRRVQTASVVAQGDVPLRVGAYELVFTDAQRAALLVELSAGQGQARGFMERGGPGRTQRTYVASGWARQRNVEGEVVTVFDLALNPLSSASDRKSVV